MLTVTLIAYVCATTAMDDCQVFKQEEYHGRDAAIRCELQRAYDEARLPAGTTKIKLSCEPEEGL